MLISGDYKYVVSGNNATIIGYDGSGGSITIPSVLDVYTVTGIDVYAFYDCISITNVIIQGNVTSIGEHAFQNCTGLIDIKILSDVTNIGDSVFAGCTSLTSITIPSSVKSIGICALYGCTGLTSVTIPSSVTVIGPYAFYACTSLISLDIPSSVVSIGEHAFENCTALTGITILSNVTRISDSVFAGCTSLTSITIPSSVTCIDCYAFYTCTSLASARLLGNAPTMGNDVFTQSSPDFIVYYTHGKTGFTTPIWKANDKDSYQSMPFPTVTYSNIQAPKGKGYAFKQSGEFEIYSSLDAVFLNDNDTNTSNDEKMIIKSSCPSLITIPSTTIAGDTFTLCSLTLNTFSLSKQHIKLDFTSNINTDNMIGTVNFQVFKSYNKLVIPVGPVWTFSSAAALTASETFSFFVYDLISCNTNNENFTYTVVATIQ